MTKRTNKSHVTTFGDKSLEDTPIGKFELTHSGTTLDVKMAVGSAGGIDARDIPLQVSYAKWNSAKTEAEKKAAWDEFVKIVADRKADEELFERIINRACEGVGFGCTQNLKDSRHTIADYDCHKDLVNIVHGHCPRRAHHNAGGWNDFNSKFSQTLVNMCEAFTGQKKGELSALLREECGAESKRAAIADKVDLVV